jgi:hypothetical protein
VAGSCGAVHAPDDDPMSVEQIYSFVHRGVATEQIEH